MGMTGPFGGSLGKQITHLPRFTSLDFYFGPLWALANPGPIKVRGRAIQLITGLDANRRYSGLGASGTDTENCQCTSSGTVSILTAALPNATLNGAGTLASFAAAAAAVQITTVVAMPAGTLTLGTFTITGTSQASGTASTCVVAAGVSVVFPGGAAGTYTMAIPAFTGTVSPGHAGDATFNPNGAVIAGVADTFLGILQTNCTSTWAQAADVVATALPSAIVGYVHLSKLNPHFAMNGGQQIINVQVQTIPIPAFPAVIRVEQEFQSIIIEPVFNMIFPCAGIIIVEHEMEQVQEWTP